MGHLRYSNSIKMQLLQFYTNHPHPTNKQLQVFADTVNLLPRQIVVWYNNYRRQDIRRQHAKQQWLRKKRQQTSELDESDDGNVTRPRAANDKRRKAKSRRRNNVEQQTDVEDVEQVSVVMPREETFNRALKIAEIKADIAKLGTSLDSLPRKTLCYLSSLLDPTPFFSLSVSVVQ